MLPLSLAIMAVALTAAPLPVVAQTLPASSAASAPAMAYRRDGVAIAMARVAAWSATRRMTPEARRSVVLRVSPDAGDRRRALDVEVRPRAEWLHDDGLRIGAGGVAYRERF